MKSADNTIEIVDTIKYAHIGVRGLIVDCLIFYLEWGQAIYIGSFGTQGHAPLCSVSLLVPRHLCDHV